MNLTASRQRKCFRYTATFVSSILCSCWELRLASQTLLSAGVFIHSFWITYESGRTLWAKVLADCWTHFSWFPSLWDPVSSNTGCQGFSLILKKFVFAFCILSSFLTFLSGRVVCNKLLCHIRGRNLTFSFCSKEAEVWRK